MNDDLISRQAVLDFIDSMPSEVTRDGHYMIRRIRLTEYIADTLPSAIVRCKDCRWGREACGNIECFVDSNIPSEYHGYEWFCQNGEGRYEMRGEEDE